MKTICLVIAWVLGALCWPAELVMLLLHHLWIRPLTWAKRQLVKRGR